jgi:glycosyltransferase involved in cell wall biosynthesis
MNIAREKKKIVWLAHEGNKSGANIAMLEYAEALKDRYEFHIILPHEGSMIPALTARGIPYSIIRQYGWADSVLRSQWVKRVRINIRSRLAIRQTERLLRREDVSLVFTNTLVPFVAAIAAHRLHIPHVWWIHEFGEEDFGFRIGWGKPQTAYKRMQQWSQLIICNSRAVARKFQSLMPAARIYHAYQPVSWKGTDPVRPRVAKFLIFGQIAPSKGHKEVLHAIGVNKRKGRSSGGVHIKGPCENQEYLEELQQIVSNDDLGDEVKIEPGFVDPHELMPLYEVLLIASRSEAFGRVIVEAIKAGLKVVVKNSGGAPELVNSTNGLMYSSDEELELILSGTKTLPPGPPSLSYSEQEEVEKIKSLLNGLYERP